MEEYTITKGLFNSNSRKYIMIKGSQTVFKDEIRLKIPFRYNRVMCIVTGDKTVQEMIPGDKVLVKMKNCGRWEIGEYSGICYKCEEISFVSSN
jgi:hypothetical protein